MKFQLLKAAIPLIGAVIFAGISGCLVYLLHKNEDEDDIGSDLDTDTLKVLVVEKISIPKEATGMIIGRQGANVQVIQRETCTNINFSSNDSTERFCIIRGQQENVKKAKELILKYIQDVPNYTEIKLTVPQSAAGKIIGKGGSTIKSMSNSTGAKILIERIEESFGTVESTTRCVTIKGTKEEVEAAKKAVLEKVKEESGFRNVSRKGAPMVSSQKRNSRADEFTANGGKISSDNASVQESRLDYDTPLGAMGSPPDQQTLSNNEIDVSNKQMVFAESPEYKSVYVTAVASANLFWVQILYPRISMLKNLNEQMTKHYNNETNKIILREQQRKLGQMVAAVFPSDNLIYRGRIAERQAGDDPNLIVVFFVDYGDVELVDPALVYDLKPEFLKLNFQAIECCLHGVEEIKPFEKKATEAFELLSHSASFVPIKAKVVTYKKKHGRQIPALELLRKSEGKEINIAKDLVKQKFLKEEEDVYSTNNQLPDDVILEP